MDDRQHASVCLDDAQAACEECRRLLVLIDPAQASTGTEVHDEGASVPDPQAGRPIP
ncbi:MAG: hypothetical protein J7507_04940 [Pseudoxanthomonas sp.]|nr:hypothetical protein [Pseudoxanthomonas sp.]